VLEPWLLHMEHNYWKCACVGTHMEQNYWHCACVGTIVSTVGTELFQSCELLTLVWWNLFSYLDDDGHVMLDWFV